MATPGKVVLIASAMYSGSTWVGYVLGSSKNSAFLGEYYRAWGDDLRQPCTLCAGRGLAECIVLHGAEKQPPETAYAFASARLGGKVIVDSSKDLGWIGQALRTPGLQASLVIVVKDPRGWIASMKRRGRPDSLQQFSDYWTGDYNKILDFAAETTIPKIIVSYDLLASHPTIQFARLYKFCGLRFDTSCLAYWEQEHHGFAANGATDALVKRAALAAPPHFISGDEQFYNEHSQRNFHDQRWKETLSAAEQDVIVSDAKFNSVLARMRLRMAPGGMEATGLLPRLAALRNRLVA